MRVLYSLTTIRIDCPEVMLVALTESRSSRPLEDWVWFCWAAVIVALVTVAVALLVDVVMLPVVLVVFKIVLTNTPNPAMRIIAITTRLTTPKETALFSFANVRHV
jgi:hypothetical protein